jgi:exopolyphosphatase/guanosine-5'-triphosphate,3'-diphosphate pyrophosphatase
MARFATLDVGTNTVLLLVAEPEGGSFKPIVERAEITRLGKGVDRTGELAPEALEATLSAIERFSDEARKLGVDKIACVATSAARDARNGKLLLDGIRERAGVDAEIITGALEAELNFQSAAREVGGNEALAVLDIGGGSTELVVGKAGKVTFSHSFDLGAVRLTERMVRHDPPSKAELFEMGQMIDWTFVSAPKLPAGCRFVGVAGTVTTVFTVSRGIEPYDAKQVHLARMPFKEVRAVRERFFSLDIAGRRKLKGLEDKRADVIPAGALILERVMERLGAHELIVSDRGIRWGLLYHRFGSALEGESS